MDAEQATSFSGRRAGATAYSHRGSRFVGTFTRARIASPALVVLLIAFAWQMSAISAATSQASGRSRARGLALDAQ